MQIIFSTNSRTQADLNAGYLPLPAYAQALLTACGAYHALAAQVDPGLSIAYVDGHAGNTKADVTGSAESAFLQALAAYTANSLALGLSGIVAEARGDV
jgi:hypothetical protein